MLKKISIVQFYKEIMEESKCDFKEAVKSVLKLQEEGLVEIIAYDNFGVPSVFYRIDKPPKNKNDWEYIKDVEKEMKKGVKK